MVAKKLLTTLFLIGFLFSWIAFIGCSKLPPPNPEAQKAIDESIREEQRERSLFPDR